MHFIAPFLIIFGVVGAIVGIIWLIAVGSEKDGGPDVAPVMDMFFLFEWLYIGIRVLKALASDPMSVLPAFGILLGSAGLIWLGIAML